MSKKIFILFLSIFVMLFAVSGAMGEEYVLVASDDAEPEAYDSNPDTLYIGYNYKAIYTRPELVLNYYRNTSEDETAFPVNGFSVEYKLSPDISGITITPSKNASGDIFILSGIVPTTSVDQFDIIATVTSVANKDDNGAIGKTCIFSNVDSLSVENETDHSTVITPTSDKASFDERVTPASGVDINKALTNYSVVINAKKDRAGFIEFIESDDYYIIDLPEWLEISSIDTAKTGEYDTGTFEVAPIKSITISFKEGTTVTDGTVGSVHVPFCTYENDYGIVLTWQVTYQAAKEEDRPFGVSGDKEVSFDFPVNRTTSTQTKTITYYGGSNAESVTSCDISGTGASLISADWTKLSGDTGSIDITVTIPETTSSVSTAAVKSDTYEGSLVFFGENGSSFDISVEIKIDTEASLSLTASTQNFSLQAGASRKVTITADSAVTDWEVEASDDISFDVTASDDTTAVVTINPLEDAEAGTYSVVVNATGENGAAGSVTLTVTVTEAATTTLTIAADVTELELEAGESDVVIVTAEEGTVASWSVDADDGITCEITASDDLEAEINVTADEDAEEGSYTVTITATDEDGNTATEEVTVTVTSSGEAAYSVSLTASNTAVTLPAGGSRDITITAGGTHSGDLTWKNSDAPMGLVVSIVNSSNSSATARIGVYATATAGTKTPITITATDAAGNSGSISITVTVTTNGSSDGSRQQVQTQDAVLPTAISDAGKTVLQSVYSGIVFLQDTPNVFGTTGIALDSAKNYIASDREAILSLRTITLSTDQAVVAIGTFPYDDVLATGQISAGENIYLELIPSGDIANAGIVTVSATKQGEIVSTSDGSAVSTMPSSNATPLAMIARDLKANTTYSPVITKLSSSGGTTTSGDFVLGPANVGCNGGFGSLFGVLAMAFTASALYFRRQRV